MSSLKTEKEFSLLDILEGRSLTRKVFPIGADGKKADKLQRQCINAITTRTGKTPQSGAIHLLKVNSMKSLEAGSFDRWGK